MDKEETITIFMGPVAQRLELRTFNPGVVGSNPTRPSMNVRSKLATLSRAPVAPTASRPFINFVDQEEEPNVGSVPCVRLELIWLIKGGLSWSRPMMYFENEGLATDVSICRVVTDVVDAFLSRYQRKRPPSYLT